MISNSLYVGAIEEKARCFQPGVVAADAVLLNHCFGQFRRFRIVCPQNEGIDGNQCDAETSPKQRATSHRQNTNVEAPERQRVSTTTVPVSAPDIVSAPEL